MDGITLDRLTMRHPERIRWEPRWSDYRLIYRGGDDFLRAAGQLVNTRLSTTLQTQVTNALTPQSFAGLRNRRFLWQLEGEADAVFYALWNRAFYINYTSAIIDYFRHWLFSEEPIIRPVDGADPPDWWAAFKENANGSGKDFTDFVRDVFLDVLICRRAGWLIGRNTAIGEQENGAVSLTPYPAEQIYDWERDPQGELLWVVLGTRETYRAFPDPRVQTETYTYVDRGQWATWQVRRGDEYQNAQARAQYSATQYSDPVAAKYTNQTSDDLELIAQGTHTLGKVPFVMLEIPEGLWIADKLAMPCLDIFNKHNRLTNAQLNACVVQFWTRFREEKPVVLGEGYQIALKTKATEYESDEDFGWKSPDVGPLEFIAKLTQEQRDEIYRIVHQMALAVDSKSIGAIARSGASKIEDRKASEIILAAYGGYVAEAMLRTTTLISEIQSDGIEWTIDGFQNFNVSSLDEEIQIAALAQSMQLKSKTAKQELELKVVGRLLDHLDEKTMETINKETRDGYDQEEEAQMAPQLGADGATLPTVQGEEKQPFGAIKSPKTLGDKAENTKAAYGS